MTKTKEDYIEKKKVLDKERYIKVIMYRTTHKRLRVACAKSSKTNSKSLIEYLDEISKVKIKI